MLTRRSIILTLALTATIAAWNAGCRTSPAGGDSLATGGVTLEILAARGTSSHALLALTRDGTLHFAGGRDALRGDFSWSGPMTDDELTRLLALLDEHDWWHHDPPSTHQPPDQTYAVKLRRPGTRRSFKVMGDGPHLTPIYDLLDRAARRRHEDFLRTMPEPGLQQQ